MKHTLRTIFYAILIIFTISACTSSKNNLADTNWQLSEINGQPALEDDPVTLNFGKDAIGGSDGCNSYGGSYSLDGTTLTFGNDLFSTQMYCTEPIMQQSSAFYSALTGTSTFSVEGEVLILLDVNGGKLAALKAVEPAE